jgi:TPR repeat protein
VNILTPLYKHHVRKYRGPAEAGKANAMFNLALSLDRLGEVEGAETWYRKAAAGGDYDACDNLVDLLHRTGKLTDDAVDRVTQAGVVGTLDEIAKLVPQTARR